MLSIWSYHSLERLFSQCLKACFEQPSSTSSKRAGSVLPRTGVWSTTMVTYLSPRRVYHQTCSSTPSTVTPSKRVESLKSGRRLSLIMALLAVARQRQDDSQHGRPIDDPERWQPRPSISLHRKVLSVAAQHSLYLQARNNRKHNSSDEYAAAIWLAAARKVREQDVYRQYRVKRQQPRTWGTAQALWLSDIQRWHALRKGAAQWQSG